MPATIAPPPTPKIQFVDATRKAGITSVHQNGADGRKFLPETMGAGCAMVDLNNDGHLDLVLVQGRRWNDTAPHPPIQIYINRGDATFRDATLTMVPPNRLYGMGIACADVDGDGWTDIFITGVDGVTLLHNRNGTRFVDITQKSGLAHPGWSTSAAFLDYDRDGNIDLFVCHYVQWTPKTNRTYSLDGIRPTYSTPQQYPGETCRLFHNRGDGTFEDTTQTAGILNTRSKALGVAVCDFDRDGWPDIVVANDTEPNFLFHNQTNGTFKEVALETGIALAETGRAKAGMGVDVGDDRGTGHESIVITNFSGEQLTLYRYQETGHFLDAAARSGIGTATQLYLGFGVLFIDVDLDGALDIYVANGHIQDDAELRTGGAAYREPSLLFHNNGKGYYTDVSRTSGQALLKATVGRAAAWGDVDNDGKPDLLVTANGGPARLLMNRSETGNWLRLKLHGAEKNTLAIGAMVRAKVRGREILRWVRSGGSYLSQSDLRPLIGLGDAHEADSVEIVWPGGQVQPLGRIPAGEHSVRQTVR
jgi:hypothetical protein